MPEIELLLRGMNVNTDECSLGLSTVALIRGRRNILVDIAHFGRRRHLLQAIEDHGLKPKDIDVVVLTHCHWDHAQNIDLFPQAEIVVHPGEVEYARNPTPGEWATVRYIERALEEHKVVDAEDGRELEPGVTVLETPGHSAGHISVLVDTADGRAAIAGDALSDAGAPARGLPFLIFWDEDQARASIERILASASMFYPGHDRPFRRKEGGEIEYLVPAGEIHISAIFDHDGSTFGMTLGLDPARSTEIQPFARKSASNP
jgi:glyoxylase-like metal-dependent hydrolase (beta-lactamase superfamily II)